MQFTKTMAGRYSALGQTLRYTVVKDEKCWALQITDPATLEVLIWDDVHDTKALAVKVAEAFEALCDGSPVYDPRGRLTDVYCSIDY